MTYAIEARDLYYTYEDGTAALKGINLRAERGRITGCLLYTSDAADEL